MIMMMALLHYLNSHPHLQHVYRVVLLQQHEVTAPSSRYHAGRLGSPQHPSFLYDRQTAAFCWISLLYRKRIVMEVVI